MESSTHNFGPPMPFRVNNVDASIAYYKDALGFALRWRATRLPASRAISAPSF